MSRDYKPKATRERASSKGSPFLVGLLIGLLLGVGLSVGVTLMINGSESPFTSKKGAAAVVVDNAQDKDTSAIPKPEAPASNDKPRFDFYTILPGSESPVTEQEIKKQQEKPAEDKPKENYFLQVGAFQTEQEADNMKAKLALLGMEAVVQTANIPDKGVWHRVRVGPFVDLNQIDKARGELAGNGFKADLIKIRSSTPDQ